jgi:nicotinate-nucleotide adenylyltransferase
LKRRIGLLGGTFDPVHFGHLQLAEIALRKCDLQQIFFIPAANPPHKTFRKITDFQHRVNMVRMALTGKTAFRMSLLEANLPAPSYTIDSLTFLIRKSKKNEAFYFIIGEDAFLEIKSWKSYQELLSLANFIVSGRSGYSSEYFTSFVQSLGYILQGNIWHNVSVNREIIFLPTATDDISSSAVRVLIQENKPLHGLVSEEIIGYIKNNNLYGCSENLKE